MGPQTVLLVDSDPDSLNIYGVILEYDGLHVLRAEDVEQGFAQACESLPDVLVVEVVMNARGGRPLAERLRCDPRTAHLPIILTSTVGLPPDDRVRAACDGYLLKPCAPTRLLREVRRLTDPPSMS